MKHNQIQAVLKAHVSEGKSQRDDWDRWHDWYLSNGEKGPNRDYYGPYVKNEDESLVMETNYPYAFIDTMVAVTNPSNPQVTITATDPDENDVARAREARLNGLHRQNKLYHKMWRASGKTAISGFCPLKTYWDFKADRPRVYVVDPRNFIWDHQRDWEDITYCAEAMVFRKEEFEARVADKGYKRSVASKAEFTSYPEWLKKGETGNTLPASVRDVFEYVVVWEFYDFMEGKFYHCLEGVDEPLLESDSLPYDHFRNPYSLLVFNDNLKDGRGVSDIKLIANAQERLNEIDTLELWFAQTSVPVMLVNKNELDDHESFVDAIANANGPGAIAMASIKKRQAGGSLRDVIMFTQTPSLSVSWDRMRQIVVGQIESTLGLPQYMRGNLGKAELATEAALADGALQTRNGRRVRLVEEVILDIARKKLGLLAQFMKAADVVPVRMPDSGEVEMVGYESLGFGEGFNLEDEWYYQMEISPYSPNENHALQQISKLQQFLAFLTMSPAVDQAKLGEKVLDLLRMQDIKSSTPAPGQMMQMPGAPGAPGAGMAGAPGSDTLNPMAALGGGAMMPGQAQAVQPMVANANPATGSSQPLT